MPVIYRDAIREILASGQASTSEISLKLGKDRHSIMKALYRMQEAYIVGWKPVAKGQYVAVWKLHTLPKNAPHPIRGRAKKIETVWRNV